MKENVFKPGEWIEGDNGYGVIIDIIPHYYEYGQKIPQGKKIGDKKKDSILLKRFCSYDFKYYPQTRTFSMILANKITNKDMSKIKSMLKDEKISTRFDKYKPRNLYYVDNFDLKLDKENIHKIQKAFDASNSYKNLQMTYKEIAELLKEKFNISLHGSFGGANCYIQLKSYSLNTFKNNAILYKTIKLHIR